jgi:hypothetical protein
MGLFHGGKLRVMNLQVPPNVVEWLRLLLRILEVSVSNLDPETGYPG